MPASRAGVIPQVLDRKYAARVAVYLLAMSLGTSLPGIVCGAGITSIVLKLPTTGPLYLQTLRCQDMRLGGTMLVLISVMLVIGNLLADSLLAWLDLGIWYDQSTRATISWHGMKG